MMIFDTNVVSAMMRPNENLGIISWINQQTASSLPFITSISIYEILYGLGVSPSGKRIEHLTHIFQTQIMIFFESRILSFDLLAAQKTAQLSARRKLSGINIDMIDTQIAGIALAHKAKLATRNTKHFLDSGIELMNPWDVDF